MTLRQQLVSAVRAASRPDGSLGRAGLDNGWTVEVHGQYTFSSGPHRAWKYLYYLKNPEGKQFGGYDRQDGFVSWAAGFIQKSTPIGDRT
jgi:hypothetical protein